MPEDKPLSMTIVAYALASVLTLGMGWLFTLVVNSIRDLNQGQNKVKEKIANNTSGLSSLQEIMTRQTKVMERVSKNESGIKYNVRNLERVQEDIRILNSDHAKIHQDRK